VKSLSLQAVAALIMLTCLAPGAHAELKNPFAFLAKKRQKRIKTLIVTGNYVKSRMLAELIQFRTKQPILLLPTGKEDTTMYFLGPELQALEVHRDDYAKFIAFLQPKKVVFLGDKTYAAPEYIDKLKPVATTWAVNSENWEQIAFSVEEVLKIRKLTFDYLVLIKQLEEKDDPKPSVMMKPHTEGTVDDAVFKGFRTREGTWSGSN
jgi:hypothetical protein